MSTFCLGGQIEGLRQRRCFEESLSTAVSKDVKSGVVGCMAGPACSKGLFSNKFIRIVAAKPLRARDLDLGPVFL